MAGGYTRYLPENEHRLAGPGLLRGLPGIGAGGHTAETLVFGEMTTGAHDDLSKATSIARNMVTQWGMSEKLGPRTFGKKDSLVFLGRDLSEQRDYSGAHRGGDRRGGAGVDRSGAGTAPGRSWPRTARRWTCWPRGSWSRRRWRATTPGHLGPPHRTTAPGAIGPGAGAAAGARRRVARRRRGRTARPGDAAEAGPRVGRQRGIEPGGVTPASRRRAETWDDWGPGGAVTCPPIGGLVGCSGTPSTDEVHEDDVRRHPHRREAISRGGGPAAPSGEAVRRRRRPRGVPRGPDDRR